jgi:hypothetical protein
MLGPGVPVSAGNVATGIGAALSAAELDELRWHHPAIRAAVGVVTTLGVIGYTAAIPRLRGALRDLDWRVVYAAAKSLGQLRAIEATGDLERIYDTYWLPQVRACVLLSFIFMVRTSRGGPGLCRRDCPVDVEFSRVRMEANSAAP